MHVAIINNGASKPEKLISLLKNASCEVFGYSQVDKINQDSFDLLVLSGSSQFPVKWHKEELEGEMSLIRRSAIPVLGVCYGCELIAVAFGGELRDRGDGTQEKKAIRVEVVEEDSLFQGQNFFEVYDAHRWVIDKIPSDLKVLARSEHGPEIIRHVNRPIFGFQFHPERMLNETFGDELFNSFLGQHVVPFKFY